MMSGQLSASRRRQRVKCSVENGNDDKDNFKPVRKKSGSGFKIVETIPGEAGHDPVFKVPTHIIKRGQGRDKVSPSDYILSD